MKVNKLNLAIAMAKKDWNFSKLSEMCGISRPTLSNLNLGKECKPQTFIKIARALEVEPYEIVEQKE